MGPNKLILCLILICDSLSSGVGMFYYFFVDLINFCVEYINADDVITFCLYLMNQMQTSGAILDG